MRHGYFKACKVVVCCLIGISVAKAQTDPHGISGENPGFPPAGYKDYLYVQIGHEPPYLVNTPRNVRSVVHSSFCTFALFDDGTVSGLGYDPLYFDPCSLPLTPPVLEWFDVPSSLTNVVSAAWDGCGYFLFLHGDGTVSGLGKTENVYGRDAVPACVTNAVAVTAGDEHAAAVLENGKVVAWGGNGAGQTNVPENVVDALHVVAGSSHTLALLADGRVVAWGGGATNVPDTVTDAVAVAAGTSHSLALLADGRVVAWGDNGCGQTNVPGNVTNAVAVAAGREHSAALLDDGSVVVWGDNEYGQADVPEYVTAALGLSAVDEQSGVLLSDGGAAVWGGRYGEGCPEVPLTTLGQTLVCRVLQTSFSDVCDPGLLMAVVRAPSGSLESDSDGDGLPLFDELFRFGTLPDVEDSDDDGLTDSGELLPFLTLWEPADQKGRILFGCHPVAVTASDTARAAQLEDGRVLIFTGGGQGLQIYTNDCGAVGIEASDSWIAALLSSGDVKVWRELSGGGLGETAMGYTNVVEMSGGLNHILLRHADGKVTCLKEGTAGVPEVYAPTWISSVTTAVKISAGSAADAILLSDESFRLGNALTTSYNNKTFTGYGSPADVAAGTNKNYVVLFSDGEAVAYKQTSFNTYPVSPGVSAIAAGGDRQLLAVMSNGTDAVFTTGGTSWSYTSVTNALLGSRGLWWRRDSRLAVSGDGDLVAMQGAVNSGRRLDFISAAVTPGGLARGIAITYSGTSATNKFSDADGMPDGWEILYGLDPLDASDQDSDADGDGLTNMQEYQNGADPCLADTDGDGYGDAWEVGNGFSPTDPEDTGADPDGDGLTNAEEYVLGTEADDSDSDDDGLSDGAETGIPFLTLWDASGTVERVYTDCAVSQVTASDTMRAALLPGGRVVVFTGSGTNLLAHTNDCGAADLDATESWIVARRNDGGVTVCYQGGGGIVFTNAGLAGVTQVSCGYRHLLALHEPGNVTCLAPDGSGVPAVLSTKYCTTAASNVVSVSAGTVADAAILKNEKVLLGNVFLTTTTPSTVTPPDTPVDVAAGSNRNCVVRFADGRVYAYNSTMPYMGPTASLFLAAGGSKDMMAVLADGRNATFASGGYSWNYTAVTNCLTGVRDLWWKRDSGLAVTAGGKLLPLTMASSSSQDLDYYVAAVTPQGLALGIAAACSGTCPTNSDVDADGLPDGWEVGNGFDPNDASDALNDTDNDGMPDWWEIVHVFVLSDGGDASGDADNDGVTNLQEYARGTDPRDPLSVNRMLYADSDIGNALYDGYSQTVLSTNQGPKATMQQAIDASVSGDVIEIRGQAVFPDTVLSPGNKAVRVRPIGDVRF